jgi:hypothetical protein
VSTMRSIHDTTDKWRADAPRFNSNALTRGVDIYNWLYHVGRNSGARIDLGRLGAAAVGRTRLDQGSGGSTERIPRNN